MRKIPAWGVTLLLTPFSSPACLPAPSICGQPGCPLPASCLSACPLYMPAHHLGACIRVPPSLTSLVCPAPGLACSDGCLAVTDLASSRLVVYVDEFKVSMPGGQALSCVALSGGDAALCAAAWPSHLHICNTPWEEAVCRTLSVYKCEEVRQAAWG